MKHRPDTRGLLYFLIAVLSVWSGELANLGGPELFQRIQDRWPALALSSALAGGLGMFIWMQPGCGAPAPAEKSPFNTLTRNAPALPLLALMLAGCVDTQWCIK